MDAHTQHGAIEMQLESYGRTYVPVACGTNLCQWFPFIQQGTHHQRKSLRTHGDLSTLIGVLSHNIKNT